MDVGMRTPVFFIIFALLLMTAHRSPAPIQEVPERPSATPAVTPTAEQSLTPEPKSQSTKARPKKRSKTNSAKDAFDGTWVGTENLGSVGTIQSTQVISGSGTKVRSLSRLGTFNWSATCDGKTMQWNVDTKYGSGVRLFTPNPDGQTALMVFGSGKVNSSVTFHRTSP
jgi:hypothetical protein